MAINNPPFQRKPNQAGTGFTNIQRILQANRANRLGSAISGGVQKAGEAARGSISQAGQQFQTDVGKERQRQQQEEQKAQSVLGDVTKATDEDVARFEKIRNAQMLGPKGLSNAEQLKQQAEEAERLGMAGGSQAGRFGLLQRYVGGNRQYTGGQQRLDSLLLGQTGSNQLRQAKKATAGLGQQAAKQDVASREVGKLLEGEARGVAERTIGGLKQGISAYDQAMADKLTQETKKREDLVKSLAGVDTSKPIELDEDTYNKLVQASAGFLGEDQSLYNVDLGKYLAANLANANKQGVQTEDEFKKAQMYGKLTGDSLLGTDTQKTLSDYLNRADKVGAFYKDNPFAIDRLGDLGEEVAKAKTQYDTEKAAKEEEIRNVTRSLGVANPNEFFVSGGMLGNLFRNYANLQTQRGDREGASKTLANVSDIIARDAARADAGNIGRLTSGSEYLKNMYGDLYGNIDQVLSELGGADYTSESRDLLSRLRGTEEAAKQLDTKYGRFRTLKKKPKETV